MKQTQSFSTRLEKSRLGLDTFTGKDSNIYHLPEGVSVFWVGNRRWFHFEHCDHCGKPFNRKFSLDWNSLFRDFHYCGVKCSQVAVAERRKKLGPPVSGARFKNFKERIL